MSNLIDDLNIGTFNGLLLTLVVLLVNLHKVLARFIIELSLVTDTEEDRLVRKSS